MVAATTGEPEAIKTLLALGAELNAKDRFGNTALRKAREQKNYEAAKLLAAAEPPCASPPWKPPGHPHAITTQKL